MTEKIKLTSDELRLMSLFQNVTAASSKRLYSRREDGPSYIYS